MPFTSEEIVNRWMDPKFKFFVNRGPENRIPFIRKDENMKGEYLGACLDYIRWGAQDSVMYELGTRDMIGFILQWKELNKENLIWHEDPLPKDFDLPRNNHSHCGDRSHTRTITDLGGRIRCAHRDCYSLISDKNAVLPLEEVLNRLNLSPERSYCRSMLLDIGRPCRRINELTEDEKEIYKSIELCPGHPTDKTIHPFDGWTFAWYVQKWHEQVPYAIPSIFGRSQ